MLSLLDKCNILKHKVLVCSVLRYLRCNHFVSSSAESELAMHEVHGHSSAPAKCIDLGTDWLRILTECVKLLLCLNGENTKGFSLRHCSRFRRRWQHMRGCSDNESNLRCLHTPTNCFQLINGAEVRSRCACVCVCEERARMTVGWSVLRVIFQTSLLLF